MSLKGIGTKKPIPFICESERDSDLPTIFHVFPKNLMATYKSLESYSKGQAAIKNKAQSINGMKLYEGDVSDFLRFCNKVENYEFSEDFSELSAKGVISEITDPDTLKLLLADMDPSKIIEVQNAVSNWEALEAGKDAYNLYIQTHKK